MRYLFGALASSLAFLSLTAAAAESASPAGSEAADYKNGYGQDKYYGNDYYQPKKYCEFFFTFILLLHAHAFKL